MRRADRLAAEAAGLAMRPARGAFGLRREEVADDAGLSANYLTETEQGRARAPLL